MSRKPLRHPRRKNQQHGYAMIIMLTVFALMSSYFIALGMSRTQAEINIERDKQTLQALQAAKAALIAYVGAQVSGTDGANDQPGALPCPSTDEAGQACGALCHSANSASGASAACTTCAASSAAAAS